MSTPPTRADWKKCREHLVRLRHTASDRSAWTAHPFEAGCVGQYIAALVASDDSWNLWKGIDGRVRIGVGVKSHREYSSWSAAKKKAQHGMNSAPVVFFGGRFDRNRVDADSPWQAWPAVETYTPLLVLTWQNTTTRQATIQLPFDDLEPAFECLMRLKAPPPTKPEPEGAPKWRAMESETEWCKRVSLLENRFEVGALEKVVMARHVTSDEPLAHRAVSSAIEALLHDSDKETVFAIARSGDVFIGCSPETLANLNDDWLQTHALAGTSTSAQDAQNLEHDEKLMREHRAVVEHIETQLRGLSESCTVGETKRRPSRALMHLETEIRAKCKNLHLLDAVGALHPTPALGGKPTAAATDWLRAHEELDRGWFGGPIGWFAENGEGQCAVAIRCLLHTSAAAFAYAGAGIVKGSDPIKEWRETEAKLDSMLRCFTSSPS